jgi:hypothetical protein
MDAVADGLDKANSQIAATQIILDEFVGLPVGGLLFAIAAFAPMGINVLAFGVAGLSYFAVGYGMLLSASALGGLLGSWVAGRIRSRIG